MLSTSYVKRQNEDNGTGELHSSCRDMTRAIDSSRGKDYFIKAENSLRMAKIALREKAYDNAAMSPVHSSINALDALTTSYLGKRTSGVHTNTLALIKGILAQREYTEVAKQFSSLMSLKNVSEYQLNLMSQNEAEMSVKWAERILNRVREKLNGRGKSFLSMFAT